MVPAIITISVDLLKKEILNLVTLVNRRETAFKELQNILRAKSRRNEKIEARNQAIIENNKIINIQITGIVKILNETISSLLIELNTLSSKNLNVKEAAIRELKGFQSTINNPSVYSSPGFRSLSESVERWFNQRIKILFQ